MDSDPEAVVSVSGCKVGFCLKQEMYSTEKKDKPCKTRMQCIYLRMYCTEIGMEYFNLNKYKDEEAGMQYINY